MALATIPLVLRVRLGGGREPSSACNRAGARKHRHPLTGMDLMLMLQKRLDEAEREMKLAQLIDPLSTSNNIAMGELLAEFEETIQRRWSDTRKALEINDYLRPLPMAEDLGYVYETRWEIAARR